MFKAEKYHGKREKLDSVREMGWSGEGVSTLNEAGRVSLMEHRRCRASPMEIWGKSFQAEGTDCAGPWKRGGGLDVFENSKEATVATGEWRGRVLGEEGQQVMGTLSCWALQATVRTLAFPLREMGSHGRILRRKETELLTGSLLLLC